jgi:hypothetical protein
VLHGVDSGACGSGEPTVRSWLDESKRFLLPLADAAGVEFHTRDTGSPKDDATTEDLRSTLRSMQQWISANPCADGTVRAQLEAPAGRYGFLALVLETNHEVLDKGERVALGDRLDTTSIRLRGTHRRVWKARIAMTLTTDKNILRHLVEIRVRRWCSQRHGHWHLFHQLVRSKC